MTKNIWQDSTALAAGFSAGLKWWLFFIVCFLLLKYSPLFSVFCGAVGGLAGGFVMAWSKSTDQPSKPLPTSTTTPRENKPVLSGLRLAVQQRKTKNKNRNTTQTSGLFGKNPPRKSKRR